jgi:hypothetical protein
VNINDAFPSNWLKASDITADLAVTITAIEEEIIEDDECVIVQFKETKKGLVLNKTNASSIAKLHGDETDYWIGKRITLIAEECDFKGKRTPCIRVRNTVPASTPSGQSGAADPARLAWKTFHKQSNGKPQEQIVADWKARLAGAFPGRDPKTLTGSEWEAFRLSDFAGTPPQPSELAEGEVPF